MILRNLFISSLIVFSCNVFSEPQEVTIKLSKIYAVKTTERFGDEVYFTIIQYSNQSSPEIFRVPIFPMYWLSMELPRIRDVNLWQGIVKDDESLSIIISVLEQDVPPWNPDDHIGSAQVRIENKNGIVTTDWGQPKYRDQPLVKQKNPDLPHYVMYGDGGEYVVQFKVLLQE